MREWKRPKAVEFGGWHGVQLPFISDCEWRERWNDRKEEGEAHSTFKIVGSDSERGMDAELDQVARHKRTSKQPWAFSN